MNICLKFESEEAAKAVLYSTVGAQEADPKWSIEAKQGIVVPNFRNIDIIGTIYKPTGATETINGREVPLTEAIPGYHCNVLVSDNEDITALTPYTVTPTTRVRVWAGE